YLSKVSSAEQPQLLRELLALELWYRSQNGEQPDPEEYHRRFPPHAELIDTVFSEVDQCTPKESKTGLRPLEPMILSGTVGEQEASSSETPGLVVLGDYELLNQLGKGGMVVVYRSSQRSANRIAATKLMRPE